MIKTEKLTKDYGAGRGILGLDLEVPEKTIFGFVGPNGSGKTTTIKLLCGLERPDRGRAWIADIPVLPKNHVQIKRTIGFLPDEFGVYEQMSVWEYLDFFGAAYKINSKLRKKRIEEVLDITDASHMIDYQVASLSRGMHQKIGIAKTLLHDPKLLILDEPANGLDPYARIEMRQTLLRLKEMGKTIMLSSHILPELGAICDLVGIIEKGRMLIQGTLREITRSLQQNIVLELQVDSDVEEAGRLLGELETVQDTGHSGNELRIDFVGRRDQIAELNAHLVQNGVRVVALKEAEIDLENVFLTVTGKGAGAGDKTAAIAKKPGQKSPKVEKSKSPKVEASADPEINAATKKARETVSEFVKVLGRPAANQDGFAVKKLFKEKGKEDILWVVDLKFDGTKFTGHLRNEPKYARSVRQGDTLSVSTAELADWMYIEDGLLVGGQTIRARYQQLPDSEKKAFLRGKPYTIAD